MENEEFDIEGRIIKQTEPVTGTIYKYEYETDGSRIVTLMNENNKSNFKTIKKQVFVNGEYIDKEVTEFGNVYNFIKKYDNKNQEVYFEQINLITGKVYKKKSIWKDGKVYLWKEDYNGENNIGFYINKNIITGLTINNI